MQTSHFAGANNSQAKVGQVALLVDVIRGTNRQEADNTEVDNMKERQRYSN